MKNRLTGKVIAEILDIHPKKATQAVDPAFDKVAKLLLAHPMATIRRLLESMWKVCGELEMSEEELEYRIRMMTGRVPSPIVNGRQRRASDVATGRVPHPADERI